MVGGYVHYFLAMLPECVQVAGELGGACTSSQSVMAISIWGINWYMSWLSEGNANGGNNDGWVEMEAGTFKISLKCSETFWNFYTKFISFFLYEIGISKQVVKTQGVYIIPTGRGYLSKNARNGCSCP